MTANSEEMPVSFAKIEAAVNSLISSIGCGSMNTGDEASPSTDLKNRQFDYRLEALQTTIKVAQKKLWTKIRDIRRERNATQPISRLPNELLVAILLEVTQYDGRGWEHHSPQFTNYYKNLDRYCEVHPLWRTVIESTPEFWSILSTWHTDAMIDRALRLSNTGPLDIFSSPISDDELKCFIRKILPHVSRWRKWFAFDTPSDAPLRLLEGVEAPRLEQFYLRFRWNFRPLKKLFIFSRGASGLHTVHLTRTVIPYTAPWLRDLRYLEIDLPLNPDYTPSRLLEMLGNNITLRRLTLVNFDCITGRQSHGSGCVILPNLEHLEVSTAKCSDTDTILSSIKAPNCRGLNIRWNGSLKRDPTARFLQSWNSFLGSKLSGEATLELGSREYVDLVRVRKASFTLTMTFNAIQDCAHWLLSEFIPRASTKVTQLTEYSDSERLAAAISRLHPYMADVCILEYTVDWVPFTSASPIRKQLQEPQRTSQGKEWLLPNLRIIKNPYPSMHRDPADWVKEVLHDGRTLIEKRWGKGAEVWATEGIKPPAMIEDIGVPSFESVKDIIQNANARGAPPVIEDLT